MLTMPQAYTDLDLFVRGSYSWSMNVCRLMGFNSASLLYNFAGSLIGSVDGSNLSTVNSLLSPLSTLYTALHALTAPEDGFIGRFSHGLDTFTQSIEVIPEEAPDAAVSFTDQLAKLKYFKHQQQLLANAWVFNSRLEDMDTDSFQKAVRLAKELQQVRQDVTDLDDDTIATLEAAKQQTPQAFLERAYATMQFSQLSTVLTLFEIYANEFGDEADSDVLCKLQVLKKTQDFLRLAYDFGSELSQIDVTPDKFLSMVNQWREIDFEDAALSRLPAPILEQLQEAKQQTPEAFLGRAFNRLTLDKVPLLIGLSQAYVDQFGGSKDPTIRANLEALRSVECYYKMADVFSRPFNQVNTQELIEAAQVHDQLVNGGSDVEHEQPEFIGNLIRNARCYKPELFLKKLSEQRSRETLVACVNLLATSDEAPGRGLLNIIAKLLHQVFGLGSYSASWGKINFIDMTNEVVTLLKPVKDLECVKSVLESFRDSTFVQNNVDEAKNQRVGACLQRMAQALELEDSYQQQAGLSVQQKACDPALFVFYNLENQLKLISPRDQKTMRHLHAIIEVAKQLDPLSIAFKEDVSALHALLKLAQLRHQRRHSKDDALLGAMSIALGQPDTSVRKSSIHLTQSSLVDLRKRLFPVKTHDLLGSPIARPNLSPKQKVNQQDQGARVLDRLLSASGFNGELGVRLSDAESYRQILTSLEERLVGYKNHVESTEGFIRGDYISVDRERRLTILLSILTLAKARGDNGQYRVPVSDLPGLYSLVRLVQYEHNIKHNPYTNRSDRFGQAMAAALGQADPQAPDYTIELSLDTLSRLRTQIAFTVLKLGKDNSTRDEQLVWQDKGATVLRRLLQTSGFRGALRGVKPETSHPSAQMNSILQLEQNLRLYLNTASITGRSISVERRRRVAVLRALIDTAKKLQKNLNAGEGGTREQAATDLDTLYNMIRLVQCKHAARHNPILNRTNRLGDALEAALGKPNKRQKIERGPLSSDTADTLKRNMAQTIKANRRGRDKAEQLKRGMSKLKEVLTPSYFKGNLPNKFKADLNKPGYDEVLLSQLEQIEKLAKDPILAAKLSSEQRACLQVLKSLMITRKTMILRVNGVGFLTSGIGQHVFYLAQQVYQTYRKRTRFSFSKRSNWFDQALSRVMACEIFKNAKPAVASGDARALLKDFAEEFNTKLSDLHHTGPNIYADLVGSAAVYAAPRRLTRSDFDEDGTSASGVSPTPSDTGSDHRRGVVPKLTVPDDLEEANAPHGVVSLGRDSVLFKPAVPDERSLDLQTPANAANN